MRGSGPNTAHSTKVMSDTTMTAGTNQPATLSAGQAPDRQVHGGDANADVVVSQLPVIRADRANLDGTELFGVTFLGYDRDGRPIAGINWHSVVPAA